MEHLCEPLKYVQMHTALDRFQCKIGKSQRCNVIIISSHVMKALITQCNYAIAIKTETSLSLLYVVRV